MIVPPRPIRRARLWREPLRRFMKRHAPKGPRRVTVDGLAFALHPKSNKSEFDIWYKRRLPEPEERAFLEAHLRPGDLFVDIGANVGTYTVPLLAKVTDLAALAFEPHPQMHNRLQTNLALNGLIARADLRQEAVGPAGTMTLHHGANAGRSSLVPFPTARGSQLVPVRPLAATLSALGRSPAAIKIDVEGFEDQALLPYFDDGAPAGLPRAIVIETTHRATWRRDCLCEFLCLGYVLESETEENALLARPETI